MDEDYKNKFLIVNIKQQKNTKINKLSWNFIKPLANHILLKVN